MEASIIVAVVAAGASLAGIALQVVEKVKAGRNANQQAAVSRIDDRIEQCVKWVEQRAEKAESALAELQVRYQEALLRLDALEKKSARDTLAIEECEAKLRRIEPA